MKINERKETKIIGKDERICKFLISENNRGKEGKRKKKKKER